MFIEQVIEFELRGHGPPGRTCTFTTGYFYDKTKISKNIFTKQCTLYFSLPEPNN